SELVSVDVEGVQIGLATCYDIRFPELFQAHGEAGAAAVVVPASWGAGEGKREQWELLVRARALDSGCWILACGQADSTASGIETKPGVPTGMGYSTVADPFGNVHDQLGAGPGMLKIDIDPKRAEESRQATAVLANRRLQRSPNRPPATKPAPIARARGGAVAVSSVRRACATPAPLMTTTGPAAAIGVSSSAMPVSIGRIRPSPPSTSAAPISFTVVAPKSSVHAKFGDSACNCCLVWVTFARPTPK